MTLWSRTRSREQPPFELMVAGLGLAIMFGALLAGLGAWSRSQLPPLSAIYGCYAVERLPLVQIEPSSVVVNEAHLIRRAATFEVNKNGYFATVGGGFALVTGSDSRVGLDTSPNDFGFEVYVFRDKDPELSVLLNQSPVRMHKIACPIVRERHP